MNNNIVFPKATDSWGEIIAFAVGADKDSFGMKKNSKGKWVDVTGELNKINVSNKGRNVCMINT